MMKILLKILVAPFALALSLLAALLVFLFDICAVLLTIASVILAVLGVALFFHADAHRRDCISVPRLPPFAVWAASGGWFSALVSGRRQVCSVSVSGKLSSLGPCWPEVGAVWMGRPFLMERRDGFLATTTLLQRHAGRRRNDCRGHPGLSGLWQKSGKTRKRKVYLRL